MKCTSPLPLLAVLFASTVLPCQEDAHPGIPDAWAQKLEWRSIGPANMSGRIVDIEVHPQDASCFWVATASGGLLKTENNGITFEHQFDRESTVSIGDMAVAPSNPDVLYVGTGENHPRNSVSYGDGVYKSTDGGKTWDHVGLRQSFQIGRIAIHPDDENVVYVGALGRLYGPNEERGLYKSTDGGKTWNKILYIDEDTGVVDLRMHPQDPDTLLVATYERRRDGFDTNDPAVKIADGSGLYRTTDGGKTFERVSEGLPSCNLGRIGLDYWQRDPDVVFAIVESEKIGQPGENVGWAGFDAEDAEAGAKVTEVTEDSPAAKAGIETDDIVLAVAGNTVLNNRQMLRWLTQFEVGETVSLEVAHGDESRTVELELSARPEESEEDRQSRRRGRRGGLRFSARLGGQAANMQDLQGKDGHEHGGVYRSDDGGMTWKRINTLNPRPMYFSQVRVDPSDDKHLYVLGVSMWRSSDGGETFTNDAGRGVHSDQHALWIDPDDGRHMILGTDGGTYVTYDRCENWDHLNHVAIGQFYHATVGPRRDYWVYGGLQDNGSWGAPMRNRRGSGLLNEDWIRIGGGDGFVCRVDELDPNLVYFESQNGGMGRTHLETMEGGRIRPQAPEGTRYRFNWQTPFILSHHNTRIYYVAGNHVFRSLDRGEGLKAISPDITRTDRGSATALAESPLDSDVLYVGTDDGALWGTRDGGETWNNLWEIEQEPAVGESIEDSRGGPRTRRNPDEGKPLAELVPGPRWVSSIDASRFEEGRVYVCLDAHRSDDDNPYLLYSEDFGETWHSITANLPWGSSRVLREDLENEDLLYAGTEFAVWASPNRGGKWTRINANLPTVAVHELAQHDTAGEMVAATHGRSLWILDVVPLRQMTAEAATADAHLFRPGNPVLWRRLHRNGGTNRQFVGENPPDHATIFYSLGKEADEVSLKVVEPSGKLVREIELEGAGGKGLHRVEWDLRGTPEERQGRGRFRGRRFFRGAPRVSPGTYQVVLEVDGEKFTQPLVVEADPTFAGSQDEDEEQQEDR